MTTDRRFPILYHVKHEKDGIPFNECPAGHGVADAVLLMAIVDTPVEDSQRKREVYFLGLDGARGDVLSIGDLFNSWIALTSVVFERLAPTDVRKGFFFEILKQTRALVDTVLNRDDVLIKPEGPKLVGPNGN